MRVFSLSFIIAIAVLVICQPTAARKFKKCELARELARLGIPQAELPDWVCLAHHESNFNTQAVNKKNSNGSWDYGIFQINDRYWCKPEQPQRQSANECRVDCGRLLQDDIAAAVTCARLIKSRQGFQAWSAWSKYCQGHKPSLKECF